MKKLLSLLSAIALCATAVSCSSKTSEPDSRINKEVATAENSEGKTEINAALASDAEYLMKLIDDFNASSEKYTVSVTKYKTDPYDEEAEDDRFAQMNLDILSGNVPDVVIAKPHDIDVLRRKDYLADLSPLLESDIGTNREDIFPNVLDGLTQDGKINAVFPSYTIGNCAYVKSSLYDSSYTNWTYAQALGAFNSLPENCDYFAQSPVLIMYNSMVEFFTYNLGIDCIDYEKSTCDFGKYLPEVLEFIKSVPKATTPELGEDFPMIEDRNGYSASVVCDDSAFCYMSGFNGINNRAADVNLVFDGEEFTYVGLPSANGTGAEIYISDMLAIMETSDHKEAAWELISSFLEKDTQIKLTNGIPVNEEAVQELTHNKLAAPDGSILAELRSPYKKEKLTMSEKAIDGFVDYLHKIRFVPYIDPLIHSMIKEECDAVLNGERSIDECVKMLNNRVSLYLSERE